jgi:hypothetical protein
MRRRSREVAAGQDDVVSGQVPDFEEELTKDEVAAAPSDTGDPDVIVQAKIPQDIRDRYEVHSYRNAATILCETRATEFADLLAALREFSLTSKMVRTAGGNESETSAVPALFAPASLRFSLAPRFSQ